MKDRIREAIESVKESLHDELEEKGREIDITILAALKTMEWIKNMYRVEKSHFRKEIIDKFNSFIGEA